MKHIISQHSHTGSYSDYSFTEKVIFYEDLNVVVRVTRYDDGKVFSHVYGGTREQQEEAKRRAES